MITLKARKTVIPRVTLSPESDGMTKTKTVNTLNIRHGSITFTVKYKTFLLIIRVNVTSGNGSILYNDLKTRIILL